MKFQLYSDIHAEFGHDWFPKWDGESDYLLLAGDIHLTKYYEKYVEYLRKISSQGWKQVFLISGNHESYNSLYQQHTEDMYNICADAEVVYLNNDKIEIEDRVWLIAGTMWTDLSNPATAFMAKRSMNDYYKIKWFDKAKSAYYRMDPNITTNMFVMFRRFLADTLAEMPVGYKAIVMTHMAPHALSGALEYKGDALNAAYFTDMSEFMSDRLKVWVHGHLHNSSNYITPKGTNVICNPYGYHGNGYDQRNPKFDEKGVGFTI